MKGRSFIFLITVYQPSSNRIVRVTRFGEFPLNFMLLPGHASDSKDNMQALISL